MGFEFDVMKVVDTAITVGVIGNDVDAIRLTKFVLLLQAVRQEALEEAMEVCRVVADRAHLSMWKYKGDENDACAELERSRVDTAELIQRALHGKVKNESGTGEKTEGRQGDPAQAGAHSGGTPPTSGGAGAGSPASGASCASSAPAEMTGGAHG